MRLTLQINAFARGKKRIEEWLCSFKKSYLLPHNQPNQPLEVWPTGTAATIGCSPGDGISLTTGFTMSWTPGTASAAEISTPSSAAFSFFMVFKAALMSLIEPWGGRSPSGG